MNEYREVRIKISGFDRFGRIYAVEPHVPTDIETLNKMENDYIVAELKIAINKLHTKMKEEETALLRQTAKELIEDE